MNVYEKAKLAWREDKQIVAAIEELNECSAALARFINGKCSTRDVEEELADAEIMLEQMRLYFPSYSIDRIKKEKLARLERRLDPIESESEGE